MHLIGSPIRWTYGANHGPSDDRVSPETEAPPFTFGKENPVIDSYGRNVNKLRVSVSEICNMACTYCVSSLRDHRIAPDQLHPDELLCLVRLLHEHAGIEKVRITGGEPLLYPDLVAFVAGIADSGIQSIGLTTNGLTLQKLAQPLREAGLSSLNVSLDSLDPENFRKLGRVGRVDRVLRGIDSALEAGLRIKLNMVVMRGQNEHEVVDLLDYGVTHGIEVRYLELMRMGPLYQSDEFPLFSMQEILDKIGERYSYTPVEAEADSTSQRFRVPGGFFGIIPNESAPFCSTCSRLRLTSNGHLVGCLSNPTETPIRDLLDHLNAGVELQARVVESVAYKQSVAFTGSGLSMSRIGG